MAIRPLRASTTVTTHSTHCANILKMSRPAVLSAPIEAGIPHKPKVRLVRGTQHLSLAKHPDGIASSAVQDFQALHLGRTHKLLKHFGLQPCGILLNPIHPGVQRLFLALPNKDALQPRR
jgi:hypothetical protein